MMKRRSDLWFYFFTKRIDRFMEDGKMYYVRRSYQFYDGWMKKVVISFLFVVIATTAAPNSTNPKTK